MENKKIIYYRSCWRPRLRANLTFLPDESHAYVTLFFQTLSAGSRRLMERHSVYKSLCGEMLPQRLVRQGIILSYLHKAVNFSSKQIDMTYKYQFLKTLTIEKEI